MNFHSDFGDFNNSSITAIFPADDEANPQPNLRVSIPVFDDDIDEARDQIFIAYLVLVDAVNIDQITIERAASECVIVDNDRKYQKYS